MARFIKINAWEGQSTPTSAEGRRERWINVDAIDEILPWEHPGRYIDADGRHVKAKPGELADDDGWLLVYRCEIAVHGEANYGGGRLDSHHGTFIVDCAADELVKELEELIAENRHLAPHDHDHDHEHTHPTATVKLKALDADVPATLLIGGATRSLAPGSDLAELHLSERTLYELGATIAALQSGFDGARDILSVTVPKTGRAVTLRSADGNTVWTVSPGAARLIHNYDLRQARTLSIGQPA